MKYDIEIVYFKYSPTRFEDDDELIKAGEDFKYFPIDIPINIDNYGQILVRLNYYLKDDFKFPIISNECKYFRKDCNLYLKYSYVLEKELNEHDFSNLVWLIAKKISEFSIALQIALPGFINFSEGYVFSNGTYIFQKDPLYSLCQEMLPIVEKIGWPRLISIEPLRVWMWIENYFIGLENFSSNSTQRAIFSFTNLFDEQRKDCHIDLIWTMVTLESLYAKNKTGIQEQLNEKIQVVLGELKDFKKVIKQMYDFRSKFLHGDLDIPSKFLYDEGFDENLAFMFKYSDTTAIAIAILIATFQFMVINNAKELEFKYDLIKK